MTMWCKRRTTLDTGFPVWHSEIHGSEYTLVDLAGDATRERVVDLSGGEGYYALQLVSGRLGALGSLPNSTPIRDLSLSTRTECALRSIGVSTVGQLRSLELDDLLESRYGPEVCAELVDLFFIRGSFE